MRVISHALIGVVCGVAAFGAAIGVLVAFGKAVHWAADVADGFGISVCGLFFGWSILVCAVWGAGIGIIYARKGRVAK